MSALNHFLFDDGAVLMTDAAKAVDGVLAHIGSKVHRFPHLNAAAGVTGTSFASPILQDFVGRTAMSFDRLVADLPAEVAEGLDYFAPQIRAERDVEAGLSDIVVVGFSESAGECRLGNALSGFTRRRRSVVCRAHRCARGRLRPRKIYARPD